MSALYDQSALPTDGSDTDSQERQRGAEGSRSVSAKEGRRHSNPGLPSDANAGSGCFGSITGTVWTGQWYCRPANRRLPGILENDGHLAATCALGLAEDFFGVFTSIYILILPCGMGSASCGTQTTQSLGLGGVHSGLLVGNSMHGAWGTFV